MVFLGGAVLANIVSHLQIMLEYQLNVSDGKSATDVGVKGRVAGARSQSA